jgi:uncharacterized protein YndB with AHSA1/START domain
MPDSDVTVEREIELPVSPEEAWAAITDADRLREWFANEVELDLREGGEGVFRWDDGEQRRAVVEEVDPLHRFAFTWNGGPDGASTVVIELEEREGATLVRVRESANAGWATALGLRAMALVAVA